MHWGGILKLYYFTTSEHGLSAIRDKRLKIALIDKLNDPFELMIADLTSSEERRDFFKYKEEVASSVGLLCFSEIWNNPTMWGHYAQKHSGICLGFEISSQVGNKVNYIPGRLSQSREELRQEMLANGEEFINKLISYKNDDWSYEKEHRILCYLKNKISFKGLFFEDFGQWMKLDEVIIGYFSSLTAAEVRRELNGYKNSIALYRADLSPTEYDMIKKAF
jgi:hypothetical protein